MNDSTKATLQATVVATLVAALVAMGVTALSPKQAAQQQVAAAAPNVVVQPLVVMSPGSAPQAAAVANQETKLGGTYHNSAEDFGAGITVNGVEVISSTGTWEGPISTNATTTLGGQVLTTSVPTDQVLSFTGTTATQKLCSIQNNTGADRVFGNANIIYATSTVTGGTYRFTISQSATAGATGTTSYFDNTIAVPTNGLKAVTATSTLTGAFTSTSTSIGPLLDGNASAQPQKVVWVAGNYINFLIASPTSTITGSCRATSY